MVEPFGDCARELAVATVEGTTGGPRAQADLFVSGVEDLDCVDALTGLLISANPKKEVAIRSFQAFLKIELLTQVLVFISAFNINTLLIIKTGI